MSAPVVNHFDTTIFLNSVIQASDMFSAFDPDGDFISSLRIEDYQPSESTGFFRLAGVPLTNGAPFTILPSQLVDLEYVAGSRIAKEGFRVIAFTDNGEFSSPADSGFAYTVRANTTAPVMLKSSLSVVADESVSLERVVQGWDSDGHPITQYYLRDSVTDNGFLELNGTALNQKQFYLIRTADMANLKYTTTGPGSTEEIYAFAYDGAKWSRRGAIKVETVVNANRPVAQFGRADAISRETIDLSPVLNVTDDDGNSIKWYEIFNTSPHLKHGEVLIGGTAIPRKQWVRFTPEQLSTLEYAAPNRDLLQQVRFRANDGKFTSKESTITVKTVYEDPPPPKIRPTVARPDQIVVRQLQPFQVDNLFTWIPDAFDEPYRFEVYDDNTDGLSSNFEMNDERLPSGEILEFDVASWNNLDYRTGAYIQRSIDGQYARVGNDDWSRWERIEVYTEPEFDQAFFSNIPNPIEWRQVLNSNAPTQILTYSYMQAFPDYETGDASNDDGEFRQYTTAQRVASNQIFRNIEAFANVEFRQVPDTATNELGGQGGLIRMGNYFDDGDDAAAAFAFFPSTAPQGGDIWFNYATGRMAPWNQGDFEYFTQQHELGHALGLKHPHGGSDNSGPPPWLPDATDNSNFTSMTYTPLNPLPFNYPVYDIYNLQLLYGANMSIATGDDLYDFAGYMGGNANAPRTVWDAGGTDTISNAGETANANIDLRGGQFSNLGGARPNFTIAIGADIENAEGGEGNDRITGNFLANELVGGLGNDRIWGGGGDDVLTGAQGDDTFVWGVADHNDTINEMGFAGVDTLELNDFPTLDSLEADLSFRFEGRDLLVDLNLDNGLNEGSLRIVNQKWGRYQVETLDLNGTRIDLKALSAQVTPTNDKFALGGGSTAYGALVIPV